MPKNSQPGSLPKSVLREFDQKKSWAKGGDSGNLLALRTFLEKHPTIWEPIAERAINNESVLIEAIAKGDVAIKVSVELRCTQMRQDMLGKSAGQLERLAVDQVICSWLEMESLVRYYGLQHRDPREAKAVDALRNSAQRRYESALRSLFEVQQEVEAIRSKRCRYKEEVQLTMFPDGVA